MGPRPSTSAFAIVTAGASRTNSQFCCNIHIRAVRPQLGCQAWRHGSGRPIQRIQGVEIWDQTKRYKSSAAATASRSGNGREAPPPAKTTKAKPPGKHTDTPSHRAPSPPSLEPTPTKSQLLNAKEQLNPPSFTYAPPLDVPSRTPTQSFISYLWKSGRSYLSFYKTGVQNVRQTSKLARTLREKAAPRPQHELLTRAEWQIVQRSRKDMMRLPAFGAIFLIFGEWTPLLVMYITPLIPEACRIPSQVQRDLAKREETRRARLDMRATVMRLMHKERKIPGTEANLPDTSKGKGVSDAEALRETKVLEMTHLELFLASARYNCHSKIWDWLLVTPPKFWLQRNVRKKFEYLGTDDRLIERDGGYQALEKREVERACVERGIDVLGKKEDEVRREGGKWWRGGVHAARALRAR